MAFNGGLLIPIVAIAATFTVPVTAIIVDYKRRRLVSEERRAMIERGMEPPPLQELPFMNGFRDIPRQRERTLQSGIVCLALGIGLGLAAFLLHAVLTDSLIPPRADGPLAVIACVLGFLGIGNLVYFAATRNRETSSS